MNALLRDTWPYAAGTVVVCVSVMTALYFAGLAKMGLLTAVIGGFVGAAAILFKVYVWIALGEREEQAQATRNNKNA